VSTTGKLKSLLDRVQNKVESLSFALYGKRQAKKNFTVSGNKE
jgi:hypothetical protein